MKRFVGYLIGKTSRAKKVAPTITQPKQLKKTMKKIGEKYKYSSAREKESIKRLDKKIELEGKRKEGIKASKELKKMVDTGRAEKIGSRNRIFSKQVPPKRTKGEGKKGEFVIDKIEKKAKGGRIGFKDGTPKMISIPVEKQVSKRGFKVSSKKVPFGGKEHTNYLQKQIRDKREPMKKGGKAKFPDLTGDGKVTFADVLKGRGVINGKKKKKKKVI